MSQNEESIDPDIVRKFKLIAGDNISFNLIKLKKACKQYPELRNILGEGAMKILNKKLMKDKNLLNYFKK